MSSQQKTTQRSRPVANALATGGAVLGTIGLFAGLAARAFSVDEEPPAWIWLIAAVLLVVSVLVQVAVRVGVQRSFDAVQPPAGAVRILPRPTPEHASVATGEMYLSAQWLVMREYRARSEIWLPGPDQGGVRSLLRLVDDAGAVQRAALVDGAGTLVWELDLQAWTTDLDEFIAQVADAAGLDVRTAKEPDHPRDFSVEYAPRNLGAELAASTDFVRGPTLMGAAIGLILVSLLALSPLAWVTVALAAAALVGGLWLARTYVNRRLPD